MRYKNCFSVVMFIVLTMLFPECAMASERSEQRTRSNSTGSSCIDKDRERIQKAYASMAARLDDFWLDGDLTQECKNRVFTTMVNHLEKTNKDS